MAGQVRGRRGLASVVPAVLAAVLLAAPPATAERTDGPMSFLENGKIRVGVNLADGGKITYVGMIGGEYPHDLVQDVQQSYYGGPPDQYWQENASYATVIANRNDGHTIYTKVIAAQSYPFYRPQCECIFETWVTLDGNAVHVKNRLTNFRADGATWAPHFQELPALYTTGDAYRVYTYDGEAPFTGAPLDEVTTHRGEFFTPGQSFRASEHWAALVNDEGFGIGLLNPHRVRFNGIPGNSYAVDWGWINGYLTSTGPEILDPNISYSYDYELVVGTLAQIRAYAVTHRPDARPVYRFRRDRQGWTEWNATDGGWPIRGAVRFLPDRGDPQFVGPETSFAAGGVHTIYVRGAWHTLQNQAELFWDTDGYSGDRRVPFAVDNDGRFHTYALNVRFRVGWSGRVHGLRLDPVYNAELGGWVDIACISWQPCPRDARAERALQRSAPVVYHDSFDTLNTAFWAEGATSPGASASVSGGRLILTASGDTQQAPGAGYITAGIYSRCTVEGNYDLRVDYRMLQWPAANGVHLNFGTDSDAVGRLNGGGESYFSYLPPQAGFGTTTDTSGSLRFVRRGDLAVAYYLHDGGWVELDAAAKQRGGGTIGLSLSSTDAEFAHQTVQVALDDFRVVRGRLSCS